MPTDTWVCPAGVTSVWVEGWGSGRSGTASPGQYAGYGGGGGAYARVLLAVTSGTGYTVQWGLGDGAIDTEFGAAPSLRARAAGLNGTTVRDPGIAADCIGDVKYSGGYGGIGTNQASAPPQGPNGGGGGSSAGRYSAGNDGTAGSYGGGGGVPGAAVRGGGGGGVSGVGALTNIGLGGPGITGSCPGGGGGGAGWVWYVGSLDPGGVGDDGGIVILNATVVAAFRPIRSLLLKSYGCIPPFEGSPIAFMM